MLQIRSRRFNTAFSAAALMACVCTLSQLAVANPVVPSATLAALADRFVDTRMDLNPLMGTMITGDARYEDKFVNNLTPAFRAKERALFVDTLNALKKIDAKTCPRRIASPVRCWSIRQGAASTRQTTIFTLHPSTSFGRCHSRWCNWPAPKGRNRFVPSQTSIIFCND